MHADKDVEAKYDCQLCRQVERIEVEHLEAHVRRAGADRADSFDLVFGRSGTRLVHRTLVHGNRFDDASVMASE
jgi:hypothetical protein